MANQEPAIKPCNPLAGYYPRISMTASGDPKYGGGWVPGIEGRDSAPGQELDEYVLKNSPQCVSEWVIACRLQNNNIK